MAGYEEVKRWRRADRDKFREKEVAPGAVAKESRFVEWLGVNEAKFEDKVELRAYDDEVRGVHARRPIQPEEIVVEIPLKCLITVEMGKETGVGRAVLEADLELDAPKHVFLMLFLLTDMRDPNSRFKPYYEMLPATLSNMPVFWREDELANLEGSYLLTQIEERNRAIAHDFEAICGAYPEFRSTATLDEFKWARMCVCSRNFGVVIDGIRTSALVPYADMLNHLRPRETKWTYENSRGAFTITALQPISPGDQIYDSYGQKCNHRFLLNYGFAVEDNREPDGFCPNEVAFEVALRRDDPLAPRKQLLWIRDGAAGPKRVRICAADNENFRAVLSLLRVAVADDDDLERVLGQHPYGSYRTASDVHFPVSLKNEVRALRVLGDTALHMLQRYPTTLEEDLLDLQGTTLAPFSNARHAKIHVKSEKVVLRHYVDFANVAVELAKIPLGDKFDAALASLLERQHTDVPKLPEVRRTGSSPKLDPADFPPSARTDSKHVAAYCNSVLRQVKRLASPDDHNHLDSFATPPRVVSRPSVQVASGSDADAAIDLKAPTVV